MTRQVSGFTRGVEVPNVRLIGSPDYRRQIDGGLYDLDLNQLRELHAQTKREDALQASSAAIYKDISSSFQIRAEQLEIQHRLQPFQRITRRGQASQPLVRVEQTRLIRNRCLPTRGS